MKVIVVSNKIRIEAEGDLQIDNIIQILQEVQKTV